MLTPAQALGRVLTHARAAGPLPAERVPLAEALGRALAVDLLAGLDLPHFAAATMDGVALRAADARRPGAALPVAFEVAAGHPPARALPPGACCLITTGAPLPAGADAVEQQELVRRAGRLARLERAAVRGRFVKPAGSDVARGAVALRAGTVLDPGALGLAAALGHASLRVRRRPRVAILPTGDELVPLGTRPGPGQIVESNAHALAAAVREAGGLPALLPPVRDDLAALGRALRGARGADVLLTSGGVSVGSRDLVRAALRAAGARLDLWRVAMRPGKPLAFGRLGRTLVFGLPGNPASALATFELFARPAVRVLAGLPGDGRVRLPARLAEAQEKPAELEVYLRVRLARRQGALVASPLPTQLSGHLSSAADHDALVILPAGRARFRAGATVVALLVRPPAHI
jgi:molybdopterin molybdotransferase